MNALRPRSLQIRLVLRLGALLLLTTVLASVLFFYLSYRTADTLSRRDLFRLADELAESIEKDGSLEPVTTLAARGLLEADTAYAVRAADGRLIAASDDEIGKIASARPLAGRRPDYFRLDDFGAERQVYYGFAVRERSQIGPVSVLVAEPDDAADELINEMLEESAVAAAWIVPVFVAATLLVGVFAIRSGLRPLRENAAQAAAINPAAMSVRLDTKDLPSEALPFVNAINHALDRLEEGFALQRRFTANAAHELRTPLAIVTAALDDLEGNGKVEKLKQDVARMNRLVEQLLHAARLDSVALDVAADVDLFERARDVVEYMAPLAIAQRRAIALAGPPGGPVIVKGNSNAVGDALRNLLENALLHTPPQTEVVVTVEAGGSVTVCDRGPGVSPEDRELIFDRFWHKQGTPRRGAGLGLAIVREIMKLHGGEVTVADHAQGGASFTLRFPSVADDRH